jgi:hypothetical protein
MALSHAGEHEVIQHQHRSIGYPRDMSEDFINTNRRPLEQVRPSYFNTPDALPREQVDKCWYSFLFKDDPETWKEFLGEVYDICDQRMFYIESTPCWPSHPDIVMEFLSIIKAYKAFQDGSVFEKEPNYGLQLCEQVDRAFQRIHSMMQRCSHECQYGSQRKVDEELSDRYAKVESLSRFIVPGVFEQLPITGNQMRQSGSKTIQQGDH